MSSIATGLRKLEQTFLNKTIGREDAGYFEDVSGCYCTHPTANPNIPEKLAQQFLQFEHDWALNEFYYRYQGPAIIEPDIGYAVTKNWALIAYSNYNVHLHSQARPLYLKYVLRRKKTHQVDEAVMINYGWKNYGHFINDIVGQIRLAEKFGVAEKPIVIPAGLAKQHYFTSLKRLSNRFNKFDFILQDKDTYINCNTIHAFNSWYVNIENFRYFIGLLDKVDFRTLPVKAERIFVGRKYTRYIVNQTEINRLLDKYGFQYVETENMSFGEQIQLFAGASYIVGIHGASLTNIIFRQQQPTKIFEIFTEDFVDPFFYWIAMQSGYQYQAMFAARVNGDATLRDTHVAPMFVDIVEFERRLQKWLDVG